MKFQTKFKVKYKRDLFLFVNPITKVMLITSAIVGVGFLLLTKSFLLSGGLFLNIFIIQLLMLLPAWIAFGRDCKYKEFILISSFLFPLALIWALVGEKKEYDYPVD